MPPTGAETGGGHGGWGGVARQSGNMACLSSGAHVPGRAGRPIRVEVRKGFDM